MEKIYVFGHRKPDTDSVSGAIALAYLKKQLPTKTNFIVSGGEPTLHYDFLNYTSIKDVRKIDNLNI